MWGVILQVLINEELADLPEFGEVPEISALTLVTECQRFLLQYLVKKLFFVFFTLVENWVNSCMLHWLSTILHPYPPLSKKSQILQIWLVPS